MWLLLVLAVAVVVVVAAVSVYVLTQPPPIPLTVSEGSTTGVIEGNFANYSSLAPMQQSFGATTYANHSGGPMSSLSLRLFTYTYSADYWAVVGISLMVKGEFASDLHLSGITLAYNETGTCIGASAAAFPNQYYPVNVSFNPANAPRFNMSGPGNESLTTTPMYQTGNGPFYEFVFPSSFQVTPCFGTDHFLGFRATVTGSFTPSVSVSVLLHVIDVPA